MGSVKTILPSSVNTKSEGPFRGLLSKVSDIFSTYDVRILILKIDLIDASETYNSLSFLEYAIPSGLPFVLV